jgi:hypothetical protein
MANLSKGWKTDHIAPQKGEKYEYVKVYHASILLKRSILTSWFGVGGGAG